jgi:hypothetical protein
LHDGEQIVDERALGEMDAQEFRDLVQDDDEPDSGLEADQDRFGNEIGDEAQPQERRQHQDGSHQQRQHGRRTQQGRRIPGRDDLADFGARQDGQRCGGAHAERARGSERRIDQHGQERRVEAHLHRQSGDRGVRHRLRNDDRCGDQAGHHVVAQPVLPVSSQPSYAGSETRLSALAIHFCATGSVMHWPTSFVCAIIRYNAENPSTATVNIAPFAMGSAGG